MESSVSPKACQFWEGRKLHASLDVANVHIEVAHRSNLQEEEEAPGIINTYCPSSSNCTAIHTLYTRTTHGGQISDIIEGLRSKVM